MKARDIPVGLAVGLVHAVLPLARTWRFRHVDNPAKRWRPTLDAEVYYTWHENLLPLTWLFAHQGVATLASRDRDGEIITRVLSDLGYVVARGSSTRGGATGFRDLLRAAGAGRALILTSDGPQGPRRRVKAGTPALAERTGRRVVPVGLATTQGWRLRTWDRFSIPAPGATVFVSCGEPMLARAGDGEILEKELQLQTRRCEQAAAEARFGSPPGVRRRGQPNPAPGAAGGSSDIRMSLERRLRAAWKNDRPHIALRAAESLYSAGQRARAGAYDRGLLATHTGGLTVVSIGGVTVGGSAKTPLAGAVARFYVEAGHKVAILTRGYPDELALHKRWLPEALVCGHPDRVRLARRAAAEGASIAVLDDGFQHRRLGRDVEILALDRDALTRTNARLLPAGPLREAWRDAAKRADLVVLTGRESWSEQVAEFDQALQSEIKPKSDAVVASLSLEAGEPTPINAAAKNWSGPPRPRLALTGIMKPNLFFALARTHSPCIEREVALPDHGSIGTSDRSKVLQDADEGGVLVTYKDVPRIEPIIPGSTPLWALPEQLVWQTGEAAFWRRLSEVASL